MQRYSSLYSLKSDSEQSGYFIFIEFSTRETEEHCKTMRTGTAKYGENHMIAVT